MTLSSFGSIAIERRSQDASKVNCIIKNGTKQTENMRTCRQVLIIIFLVFGLAACKTNKPTIVRPASSIAATNVPSVIVNGAKLHYVEQGSGEVLMFIHNIAL